MTRTRWVLSIVLLAALTLTAVLYASPSGPRSIRQFDPVRMADYETRMWQAYYAKEKVQLFSLLVRMLHEQNGYRWIDALRAGFRLARAAAVFGDARGDYQRVIPDLVEGYTVTQRWTGAGFDPASVAQADLAWWEARRTPGQDSAEHVGDLIGRYYALLYEAPLDRVAEAGRLRAEAAALRDRGGERADWDTVSRLLQQSYASLHAGLHTP